MYRRRRQSGDGAVGQGLCLTRTPDALSPAATQNRIGSTLCSRLGLEQFGRRGNSPRRGSEQQIKGSLEARFNHFAKEATMEWWGGSAIHEGCWTPVIRNPNDTDLLRSKSSCDPNLDSCDPESRPKDASG